MWSFCISGGTEAFAALSMVWNVLRVYLESLVTHTTGLLSPKVVGNSGKVAYNYGLLAS